MTTQADLFAVLSAKPLSQLTEEEMREARSLALSILRAAYYRDVRSVAEDIRDAVKDGEITDRDGFETRLHEECDGNQRVIYTSNAQECILLSDNSSAYVDSFGEEGIVSNGDINWSALAYSAFEADVREQLDAEGVDPDTIGQEDEEDDASDGPDEDDITTNDGRVFYQSGKHWLTIDDASERTVSQQIRDKMEAENFHPNVWMISDHGNPIPFSLED